MEGFSPHFAAFFGLSPLYVEAHSDRGLAQTRHVVKTTRKPTTTTPTTPADFCSRLTSRLTSAQVTSGRAICERITGAAMRRWERRLRSRAKHERLSIAMALAEKLHHSAQTVMEQHDAPRGQAMASAAGEGEEYKKNALYKALRGQKTPLPGMRTVSTAPVPQVALSDLGGEVVHDATMVDFLVRQTLLKREEEKRKEKEKVKEQEAVWFVMRDERSVQIIAQFRVNDDCDFDTTGSWAAHSDTGAARALWVAQLHTERGDLFLKEVFKCACAIELVVDVLSIREPDVVDLWRVRQVRG